jgi:predicted nucleotidyltransferase
MATTEREGMTETARAALRLFADAVRRAYGDRLEGLVVFGSRARGSASARSDLDVAVILADERIDRHREKMALADLAYDAIVETGLHVQPWPVSSDEWRHPRSHANPSLVRAMRRDGRSVEEEDVSGTVFQSARVG